MPNQHARFENAMKGEEAVQENSEKTYRFVDELLEEAVKMSSKYESGNPFRGN